ncbi:MAG: hypothetical protein P8O75_04460 [Gammaproteobacteria bacterium]|nr:hypothetical protein [Gammaproteobacteria bacterium]
MRKLIPVLLLILSPITAFAECTPDTVQFYLDKGFTPDQITKLCSLSGASEKKSTYKPYQKPVVVYQEGYAGGVNADLRKAVQEIRGSIDARSVDVTDTHLNYITRQCVVAGNSPEAEQRVVKCVDVAFSVARDGLRVVESGAGMLFFGQQKLDITSSAIERKYVTADPWAAFAPDIRFLLQRKFESMEQGNDTTIPLRKGVQIGQLVSAIRTLAAADENAATNSSEVSRVLSNDYQAPTEEEYEKNQRLKEPAKKEKEGEEKKKRWWNPFD